MRRNYELLAQWFLILQLILGAIALSQLPIQLHDDLATNGKFVYTLIAQFEDDILATWSNEDIAMLAQTAYTKMTKRYSQDRSRYPKFKKQPPLMSAIVVGRSVYFSSSLNGGGSLQYVPNENCDYKNRWTPGNTTPDTSCPLVYQALKACQLRSSNNSGHRTGGNCGEVMAAMTFCTMNPGGDLGGAKVVSYGKGKGVEEVWDPCIPIPESLESMDTWGCSLFAQQLGLVVVGKGTNPSERIIPKFTPTYPPFT